MADDFADKERAYRQVLAQRRRLHAFHEAEQRAAMWPTPDQLIADRRIAAEQAKIKHGFSLQPVAGHSWAKEAEYWRRQVRSWLR